MKPLILSATAATLALSSMTAAAWWGQPYAAPHYGPYAYGAPYVIAPPTPQQLRQMAEQRREAAIAMMDAQREAMAAARSARGLPVPETPDVLSGWTCRNRRRSVSVQPYRRCRPLVSGLRCPSFHPCPSYPGLSCPQSRCPRSSCRTCQRCPSCQPSPAMMSRSQCQSCLTTANSVRPRSTPIVPPSSSRRPSAERRWRRSPSSAGRSLNSAVKTGFAPVRGCGRCLMLHRLGTVHPRASRATPMPRSSLVTKPLIRSQPRTRPASGQAV